MASIAHQRRQFLKALGATAAATPFFDLLRSSAVQGQGASGPLRLVMIYTSHGGDWTYLRPRDVDQSGAGVESSITPAQLVFDNSVLEPLSKHASRMLVLEGLSMAQGLMPQDPDDPNAPLTLFSGHDNTGPNAFTGAPVEWIGEETFPTGPSLDYILGQALGDETAVRSIQMGMGSYTGHMYGCVSYNDAGQRMPGIGEAQESFRQLFGDNFNASPDEPTIDLAARNDRKVVDALHKSAQRLSSRLAGPEKAKLDEHLAALADIEGRLARQQQATPISCGQPTPPASNGAELPETSDLQLGVLAQALACDRTRFATMSWASAVNYMPFLFGDDVTDLHSQVAHTLGAKRDDGQLSDEGVKAGLDMARINHWYAERISGLMDQLEGVQEGDGTVLDNTLIVWAQDFGPQVHGGLNVPYILLGGAAKKFRMGRYVRYQRPVDPSQDEWTQVSDPANFEANNKLLVSLQNAFGIEADSINSDILSGGLPLLT